MRCPSFVVSSLALVVGTAAVTAVFAQAPAAPQAANAANASPEAQRWWAHVSFLATDAMKGRNTGSPEHRLAAEYVAGKFKAAGLEPAGTSGYFQPVSFISRQIDEPSSSLALVRDGKVESLALGPDASFGMRIDSAPEVDAPLVFAGYGLTIPEVQHDDFKGLDVKGKVVVILVGSPAGTPGPLSAHYQSAAVRWANLKRLGALGTVTIANPKHSDVPWERATLARLSPAMALAEASLEDTTGQKVAISVNPAQAERWFAGSGHTFAEVLAAADASKPVPAFPLPSTVRAKVKVTTKKVESDNVAAKLPGSDPSLKSEYVVLTAHLDHVGVGGAINGDTIYNGAMDNASGIATLIETATTLAKQPTKAKRSIVIVAVTAEEKGLLGSRYYASHPTVNADAIVADINMDMFLPLYPFKILTVFGLDESDLGTTARAVAGEMGLTVQPDMEPARNRFIRSDQYSFIRNGVPALALKVGYEPNSPEAAINVAWTKERYHAPSDDLQQPVDLESAAGFTKLVARLTDAVANAPQKPRWNDNSFFKRFAKTAGSAP